ncbi:ATP-binding protein [Candidatus Uhrbacteria bacterium]|nr:ATP-binding protein [Candidatus Uhrbacteria bacterium]
MPLSADFETIEIGDKGVKEIVGKFKPYQAIAEYIWNGFDANASEVHINYEGVNIIGNISRIMISDNGNGIPQEELSHKFKPFYESEKKNRDDQHKTLTHGKNGIGRLSFVSFSAKARWLTRYEKQDGVYEYEIEIEDDKTNQYLGGKTKSKKTTAPKGTTVTFDSIFNFSPEETERYLKQEFGWFLELYKSKDFKIYINGEALKYDEVINDRDCIDFVHAESGTRFKVNYIQWSLQLQNEYSRYYLLNSHSKEVWKDTTKLNKKGDGFYHSIYVQSDFFNDFRYNPDQPEGQDSLIGHSRNDDEYKFLMSEMRKYLRKKRKPFLVEHATEVVKKLKDEGTFPTFSDSPWDQLREEHLENVVEGVCKIQPQVFTAASPGQRKTIMRMLNALLDSDEREQILPILDSVLELDRDDKILLKKLLEATELSNIIKMGKLVADRYSAVEYLKQIVFNETLSANERDHLQKIIDDNYWLFGEQYNLVCTTEADFESALRSYQHMLNSDNNDSKMNDPDKNKEMDIFLCRQNYNTDDTIDNIIIELKKPSVKIGEKEVSQIKRYMEVVINEPRFNSRKSMWRFILIGTVFDSRGYIERETESAKPHGEKHNGLIFNCDNYKVYVKKWSEIFSEFELRHRFINDRLKLRKDRLTNSALNTAALITDETKKIGVRINDL